MERCVGRGGWSLESAGVRAINLAGISELMNVIKIQPPTRWARGEGRIGWGDAGRAEEGKTLRIAATIGRRNDEEERKEKRNPEKRL